MDSATPALQALAVELQLISVEKLRHPDIPVDECIIACTKMAACARSDAAFFAALRIDVIAKAAHLELAAAALDEAQRLWRIHFNTQSEAEKVWALHKDEAYALRAEMQDYLSNCVQDTAEALNNRRLLKESRRGRSHAAMIHSLASLSALAADCAAPLMALGYGPEHGERLESLHVLLSEVYGRVLSARRGHHPAALLRDRAYTLVRILVADIRHSAKLALRREPDRRENYRDPFRR